MAELFICLLIDQKCKPWQIDFWTGANYIHNEKQSSHWCKFKVFWQVWDFYKYPRLTQLYPWGRNPVTHSFLSSYSFIQNTFIAFLRSQVLNFQPQPHFWQNDFFFKNQNKTNFSFPPSKNLGTRRVWPHSYTIPAMGKLRQKRTKFKRNFNYRAWGQPGVHRERLLQKRREKKNSQFTTNLSKLSQTLSLLCKSILQSHSEFLTHQLLERNKSPWLWNRKAHSLQTPHFIM